MKQKRCENCAWFHSITDDRRNDKLKKVSPEAFEKYIQSYDHNGWCMLYFPKERLQVSLDDFCKDYEYYSSRNG